MKLVILTFGVLALFAHHSPGGSAADAAASRDVTSRETHGQWQKVDTAHFPYYSAGHFPYYRAEDATRV